MRRMQLTVQAALVREAGKALIEAGVVYAAI
jgi:hypothetical protein